VKDAEESESYGEWKNRQAQFRRAEEIDEGMALKI
jgi:hypothetical protein